MAVFRRSQKNRPKVRPRFRRNRPNLRRRFERNRPNLRRRRNGSHRQKRIWFERLPDLVKCKILRQYVPVLDKIRTLPALPEFSRQLRIRWSWMNASDAFAEVASVLGALRDGFYVPSKDLPDHGYHVSSGSSGKTIVFTLFSVTDISHNTLEVYHGDGFDVSAPASNFRDFLSLFSKNYCPIGTKPVLVYEHLGDIIFVNRPAKVAMWKTEFPERVMPRKICPIQDDRCSYAVWGRGPSSWSFCLKNDDSIEFEIEGESKRVEPTPLEAHVLKKGSLPEIFPLRDLRLPNYLNFNKEGPVPAEKKLCLFEFSLEGKETISLSVTTPYLGPCLHLVGQKEHKNWLETFSKEIVKNIRDAEEKDFIDFMNSFG